MLGNHIMRASLPASDLDRARKFYEETLGLEVLEADEGGITFKSGSGSEFFVFTSMGKSDASFTQGGWEVDDIESEVGELKSRGVKFEEYDFPGMKTVNGIAETGPARGAWFKDSEGNLLGLVQLPRT
jgi:catechol 2,3-dioxygenase-like lactoylglutathione lyase family enzyme